MSIHVLLVENDEELRRKTSHLLTVIGINVSEAKDGKEALELIKEKNFDVVISAIRMPKMNGYELLKEVRNTHGKELLPFIFLSSLKDSEYIIKALELGADDYITKPFEISEVANSIKIVIEKKKKIENLLMEKISEIKNEYKNRLYFNETSNLPNFNAFMERINTISKENEAYYILYDIHLDCEYEIDIFFNKKSKEKITEIITKRLSDNLKQNEELYHIGPFEFLLFSKLEENHNIEKIENRAKLLLSDITKPIDTKEIEFSFSSSIGINIEKSGSEDFKNIYNNAKIAKVYIQHNGGNNFAIFNNNIKNKVLEVLSVDIKNKISVTAIKPSTETQKKEIYETKIFFLYPHSIFQKNLIRDIVRNEYAAYAIDDHIIMRKILKKYSNSILFINIEAHLTEKDWEKYIKEIRSDPETKNVRIGVISFFEDNEREKKFLLDLMVDCGYIKLKTGYKESLEIILKALEVNEARGKRKYVRVKCEQVENVGCNIKIGDKLYNPIIKDISSFGMAFYFKDNETFFKKETFIENIQLKLKGVLLFVSGKIYDVREIDDKIIYVLIFHNLQFDEKEKIHDFIYKVLQEEMGKEIECFKKDESL